MTTTIVSPRLLLIGGGCVAEVASVLEKFGLRRPLVVTDAFMVSSGLVERCLAPLAAAGIAAHGVQRHHSRTHRHGDRDRRGTPAGRRP